MKIDLDVYDRMALRMKEPQQNTTHLTKLPDDFEPRNTDHPPDEEADLIANSIR